MLCPATQKWPHLGFCTHSEALLQDPRRFSQTFNALGLLPSELCSFCVIEEVLRTLLPLLRFAPGLFRVPNRRSSGLFPRRKPFSLLYSQTFYSSGGDFCSLGLLTFRAFSHLTFARNHLPFLLPLSPSLPFFSQRRSSEDRRVFQVR